MTVFLSEGAGRSVFPWPQGISDSPIARSDSTFSSSIEGKVTNGYPSGTVFRGSNLTTTRQIEDFLHMLPVRPEIKNA